MLEVGDARLITGETMTDRLDDFVSDRDGVFLEAHDLDDATSRTDVMPDVADFVEIDEKVVGEQRFLYLALELEVFQRAHPGAACNEPDTSSARPFAGGVAPRAERGWANDG